MSSSGNMVDRLREASFSALLETARTAACAAAPAAEEAPPAGMVPEADAPVQALVRAHKAFVFPGTDDSYKAEYIIEQVEAEGRFFKFDEGRHWQYRPELGRWRVFTLAAMRLDTLRLIRGARQFNPKRGNDGRYEEVEDLGNVAKSTMAWIESHRTDEGFFRRRPQHVAAFTNGVARIEGGKVVFEPASAEHRIREEEGFDFAYPGPGAQPQVWLNDLLGGCFKGDPDGPHYTRLVGEFAGTCIFGLATRLQQALVFYGAGNDGKSTVQEALESLFPTQLKTHVAPHKLSEPNVTVRLVGTCLNSVHDARATVWEDPDSIKGAITGNGTTVKTLYKDHTEGAPTAGHVISINRFPQVFDRSPGFWRRFEVIPFRRRFSEEEADDTILERVKRDERPALASWAMDLAAALHNCKKPRLQRNAAMQDLLDEWKSSASQTAAYIYERLDLTGGKAYASDIFQDYTWWARRAGHRVMNETEFGAQLVEFLGYDERKRDSKGRYYRCTVRAKR